MWTWRRPDLGDVAALFYTSGTTGAAKGVPLSHANLVFQIDTLLGAYLVSEDDRVLLPLPLHHVYPFVKGMPRRWRRGFAHRLAPIAYGSATGARPEGRRGHPDRRRPAALRGAVFGV